MWLKLCNYSLMVLRFSYLILRAGSSYSVDKNSFWFSVLLKADKANVELVRFTRLGNFDKYTSKSKFLFPHFFRLFFTLLNRNKYNKLNTLFYNYPINSNNILKKDVFLYNYMSSLLHNYPSYGYLNSKVRLHLGRYSEVFHFYLWRSNLIFELQLAFVPFLIALFLIVPSVIVTTFIVDPEKGHNFDIDSNNDSLMYTIDVIGHQ